MTRGPRRISMSLRLIAACVLWSLAPAPAAADDVARGWITLGATYEWADVGDTGKPWDTGQASSWVFTFSPGWRLMIVENVLLGLDLRLDYRDQDPRPSASPAKTDVFTLAAVPSLGYNLDLSRTTSVLPQVELLAETGLSGPAPDRLAVGATVWLLVHPEGFLLGVGPEIHRDVTSSFELATTFGIRSMIGFWF